MALTALIRLPPLPPELRLLYHYLLERDGAPPTGELGVQPIVQSVIVAGWDEDVISWTLAPPAPFQPRRDPDGFLVWWSAGTTTDPLVGGLRLSVAARSFSMVWPDTVARSYAVAAFRSTWQGEKATPKVQDPTWVGAS